MFHIKKVTVNGENDKMVTPDLAPACDAPLLHAADAKLPAAAPLPLDIDVVGIDTVSGER